MPTPQAAPSVSETVILVGQEPDSANEAGGSSTLDDLLERLDILLDTFARAEVDHADAIEAVDPGHRAGAINLVHFTALRQHDVRALQSELMDVGVTSLATTEANVRAKVLAARNVVAALRGDVDLADLDTFRRALAQGDQTLEANSLAIFGPMRSGRPTRIMVTLPSEAGDQPELVASFVDAGMDVARVNCAHDDPAAWARMAANVKSAAASVGRHVLVSMDLPGPKLRTGPIANGPAVGRARVTRSDSGQVLGPASVWLTASDQPTAAPRPTGSASRPTLEVQVDRAWLAARRPGDRIKVTDLRRRRRTLTVTDVDAAGVLAGGQQNVYLTNGSELTCRGDSTVAGGVAPTTLRLSLAPGDRLILTTDLTAVDLPAPGAVARIGCTLPEAVSAMRPGDAVMIDDGAITAEVESVSDQESTLRITRTKPGGQRLGAEKGINLPDTVLPLPALTDDDVTHLPFIAQHADMVAVSFVRTPGDIEHVLDRLAAAGAAHLGLLLKIETRQGFENLPAILLVAMRHPRLGVMIARGDLAVEIGFERLAEVPRQILALCEAAHVPSIWATQVLESLAKIGQPSRAEITDVAASQRADCVMLNKGPYIVDAIEVLDDILARMGQVQRKGRTLMRHIHSWDSQ
jgi:pyruvate kinase